LALIGPRWAGDGGGKSRLHDPDDWVRVEVATALRRGVRVIPVLLDGARMLARMNAVDVRTSRLNADVFDLVGSTLTGLGEKWPPDEPGGKIYAVLAGLYALFAGAAILFVMLASMFMPSLGAATVVGVAVFALTAAVLLRLPIHSWVRTLSRQRALQIGALGHLAGFLILAAGASDIDGVMVFLFGIVPAAALFLASFAMRRLARG
jgi:hypothetical protein